MILYLATPNTMDVKNAIAAGKLGAMLTPDSWKQVNERVSCRFPWVGLDNGCFSDQWDHDKWLAWLEGMRPRIPECLFAVVPDVVADHEATLDRWGKYAQVVKDLGFPAAFVLQDGASRATVPWDEIDALFIGGSTEFKLSETAWEMSAYAQSLGIWTHMGRVNSFNRIRRAAAHGIDSVDGTYLRWPDTNLPKRLAWLAWLEHNRPMR